MRVLKGIFFVFLSFSLWAQESINVDLLEIDERERRSLNENKDLNQNSSWEQGFNRWVEGEPRHIDSSDRGYLKPHLTLHIGRSNSTVFRTLFVDTKRKNSYKDFNETVYNLGLSLDFQDQDLRRDESYRLRLLYQRSVIQPQDSFLSSLPQNSIENLHQSFQLAFLWRMRLYRTEIIAQKPLLLYWAPGFQVGYIWSARNNSKSVAAKTDYQASMGAGPLLHGSINYEFGSRRYVGFDIEWWTLRAYYYGLSLRSPL